MNDELSRTAQRKKNLAEKFICESISKISVLAKDDSKARQIIDALNFAVTLINESPISFWEEEKNQKKDRSAGRIVKWL